uniref:Uncharacterized protein n=1 Tax=Physcomitrium patens TaxID=3218 RepID=A0A2K1J4A0_PHYPA|nr:hypothetical protein PHYPA_022208 [Physcomitrium patens]
MKDMKKRTHKCTSASLSSQTAEKLFSSRTVCVMKSKYQKHSPTISHTTSVQSTTRKRTRAKTSAGVIAHREG